MAINKLRYYAVVVETKNLRKAADLIGITPGSLSKAVASLEDELGVKLLRPEGRGIEITEQGWQVYRRSAHLLEEFKRFREEIGTQAQEPTTQLRLGSFEVFTSYFLSSFLPEEYPQHDVLVLELTPGEMEQAILDHMIDYAITYLPMPDPRLEFTEVGSFEMAVWGTKHWFKQPFDSWPFAVPTTSVQIHSSPHTSLDMWPQAEIKRRVKYKFELLETALQTSRQGKSVLHCPDFIVSLHNRYMKSEYRLERLPYPLGFKRRKPEKIFLVSKKGGSIKPLEGKLAKFLRSLK